MKTITYTLQPLDRSQKMPKQYTNLYQFWKHKLTPYWDKVNDFLEPYVTNGRKYARKQRLIAFCNEFNAERKRKQMYKQWGNPSPHQEQCQHTPNAVHDITLSNLKYGSL